MEYKPLTFNDFLNEQMQDPESRREWEATEAEYQIKKAMVEARIRRDLTQKQLSELTGIAQADISRLENGSANPSLATLRKLAKGMGMRLKIEFVPIEQ